MPSFPIPPTNEILSALQQTCLPAAGGAALVMAVVLACGRWAGALGSAAAIVVGFAWSNYTFAALSWEGTGRLIPWKSDSIPPPAVVALPRAAIVLVVVGLASRWLGIVVGRYQPPHRWWGANLMTWAPRVAGVAVVSGWLVPAQLAESGWVWPLLAATMLLNWIALDWPARDGVGGQVAGYQAAAFLAAAVVLLYAHSGKYMEAAVTLGMAMAGVAVVAGPHRADTSGAVPAGAAFLPGLLLTGWASITSEVPVASYWLLGLSPLTLFVFCIPVVARQNRWVLAGGRAALFLIPLIVAVALAVANEQVVFDDF